MQPFTAHEAKKPGLLTAQQPVWTLPHRQTPETRMICNRIYVQGRFGWLPCQQKPS